MSTLPASRRSRAVWPDLAEWFAGFPSWAEMRPVLGGHVMRLEDEMKDGHYEVRAEMPGIDPGKDVDITVRDGVLTIKAERSEKKGVQRALGVLLRLVRPRRLRCRQAPTRTTSTPATTRASSPSRCRSVEAQPSEKRIEVTSG